METYEPENAFEGQVPDENVNEEKQPQILVSNNEVKEELRKPSPGDEIEPENEASDTKDYSILSKKELLQELLMFVNSGREVETIRRDVETLKNAFYKLYRQEQEAADKARLENPDEDTGFVPDTTEQEFRAILNKFKAAKAESIRNAENAKEENYRLKLAIIEELKELVTEEENLNLTFQKFHDILNRWKETGQVPQAHAKDLWETWHHYVEMFYDYVKINRELRDLDLKRNLEAKEQLIAKAEDLLGNVSINEAFVQLQDLHNRWREIGPVSRERKNTLWEKFKEISSEINKKYHAYFEQRKEEQQNNLKIKYELCERAEKLNLETYNTIGEWQKAADKLLEILEEWKGVGFIPKKENGEAYARFKKTRDEFFLNRRKYYRKIKHETQVNFKEKQTLCEQAEAVMDSVEWKTTTDLLIDLQKRWKETGPVPHKQSDALWKRFRLACNTFFNRKSEHFSAKKNTYESNLKDKEQLISEIEAFVPDEDATTAFDALNQFKQRWREIGHVHGKHKEKLQERYQNAIDKQFRKLKLSDSERKMLHFKGKLETMNNSGKTDRAFRSERERLFGRISQLESDIALWENNIGFFAKSKKADGMIAEVRHKIQKAKENIKVLEEQVRLIDEQYED